MCPKKLWNWPSWGSEVIKNKQTLKEGQTDTPTESLGLGWSCRLWWRTLTVYFTAQGRLTSVYKGVISAFSHHGGRTCCCYLIAHTVNLCRGTWGKLCEWPELDLGKWLTVTMGVTHWSSWHSHAYANDTHSFRTSSIRRISFVFYFSSATLLSSGGIAYQNQRTWSILGRIFRSSEWMLM